MARCLTPIDFERYARGELDPQGSAHLERHVTECGRCRAAYESFVRSDHQLADDKPAGANAPRLVSRIDETVSQQSSPRPDSPPEPPPSPRPRLPQIGGYEIRRIIGRGGMGVVYEAVQQKLSRTVALKLLPAVMGTSHPELITRFRREATAAARLHHTNIIPIYDFGESPDGYYYAMELLDGVSLKTLITQLAGMDAPHASHTAIAAILTGVESMSESGEGEAHSGPPSGTSGSATTSRGRPYYRQVARWAADVAEALHYAHLQGMVHRDVKPGNLMVNRNGRIVVLDFGLVKTTDDQSVTSSGSLVGTYRYMSPEQIGAKRVPVDARADVYSLGATLYELLAFQPAFWANERPELLSQILFKEPAAPRKLIPAVPVDLQTICLKAMEKSPGSRYQSAKEMANDLSFYLQDLAIVARPQGPIRRAVKFIRRHRVQAATLVAALLVIAAAAIAYVSVKGARESRSEARRIALLDLLKQAASHREKSDWDAARRSYEEALSMEPNSYGALVSLAAMYQDQFYADGNAELLERAEGLLDQAVKARPDRHESWNVRGIVYRAWSRPADAIEAYREGLKVDDTYFPFWVNLGIVHATEHDLTEAEGCLKTGAESSEAAEQVVESDAAMVMPWRLLAAVQMQLGQNATGDTLAKALRLSQSRDVATLVLASMYYLRLNGKENAHRALTLVETADMLDASAENEPTTTERPNEKSVRVKRTLALARLRNEQWDRAISAAQAALDVGSQPALPELIRAVAWARLGGLAKARASLEAATAAWPAELVDGGFQVICDGHSLWFDTADELTTLQAEASQVIERTSAEPQ